MVNEIIKYNLDMFVTIYLDDILVFQNPMMIMKDTLDWFLHNYEKFPEIKIKQVHNWAWIIELPGTNYLRQIQVDPIKTCTILE